MGELLILESNKISKGERTVRERERKMRQGFSKRKLNIHGSLKIIEENRRERKKINHGTWGKLKRTKRKSKIELRYGNLS